MSKKVTLLWILGIVASIYGITCTFTIQYLHNQNESLRDRLNNYSLEDAISKEIHLCDINITDIQISSIYSNGYELYPIQNFVITGNGSIFYGQFDDLAD